uniref:DUF3800 domain-containing protein n=1 Tax=Candidatus Kentrum sp. DK TaxID=2126562 RepID=A0A450SZ26_9GAMM|nr:MAG: Protein of unknown function (DUF3800) [Candidatus Kentron sp. DK]
MHEFCSQSRFPSQRIPKSDRLLALENDLSRIAAGFFDSRTLTTQTELHGKDLFHGKGNAKGRKLADRVRVFQDIAALISDNGIPVRMIRIDVEQHRKKYAYPEPEYHLGLMLLLERFCEYLDASDDLGLAFGDYEADEVTRSVADFSEFKARGKTPMYLGRPLERLLDTIYFTQSHHSRFLQAADLLVYMAGRYENTQPNPDKWHEREVNAAWEKIKASGTTFIQRWP